jgi:hypothetical protein
VLEFFQAHLWIVPLGFAVALVFIVVGLVGLIRERRTKVRGDPTEQEIEAALQPWIQKAIWFAYKQSERLLDAGQERLHGLDKRKLATLIYDTIPDQVIVGRRTSSSQGMYASRGVRAQGQFTNISMPGGGVAVPVDLVKRLVSRERFAELVDNAFAEFLVWVDGVQARLDAEIDQVVGGDLPDYSSHGQFTNI